MKILVTGLCTLHHGRLEFGNVGNYYIVEPLFRELHRVFPTAELMTTFQMTDEFVKREQVTVLPMEIYYAWKNNDIENAQLEYEIAKEYKQSKCLIQTTGYINAVRESDLVINVSGDMWGDNAEHVGTGRFLVDLLKMRTAQLLGTKTILFGGTPGPFNDNTTRDFAKEVLVNFDLVVNREPTSSENLEKWGFDMHAVKDFACPAFLFEPASRKVATKIMESESIEIKGKPIVGFTIGGFNMPIGPYDMWPRDDSQYEVFVHAIEYIVNELEARVVLISHTNGFELPPHFKLINGRDYPILKQLQEIVLKRGNIKNKEDVLCIETPHIPRETKALIGMCDMFITGRVHASVAAITQYVPTVFINYEKSFIPSTKMYGFSSLAGVDEFVTDPGDLDTLCKCIKECWENRKEVHERLQRNIPKVKERARLAFDFIAEI